MKSKAYKEVERIIHSMEPDRVAKYCEYWKGITPKTEKDIFNRWLFAFASVHTTWQSNLKLYNALTGSYAWCDDPESLLDIVRGSGAGLHVNRTRFLSTFISRKAVLDLAMHKPSAFMPDYRDNLVDNILGLGMAKSSFACELIDPFNCHVVCLDTHMLQLYGMKPGASVSKTKYKRLESHWTKTCRAANIPSPIARHIFWDDKQGQTDTRYWTHVFENAQTGDSW